MNVKNETKSIQNNIEDGFASARKRKIDVQPTEISVYAKEICDIIVIQMKSKFPFRGHLQAADFLLTGLWRHLRRHIRVASGTPLCHCLPR